MSRTKVATLLFMALTTGAAIGFAQNRSPIGPGGNAVTPGPRQVMGPVLVFVSNAAGFCERKGSALSVHLRNDGNQPSGPTTATIRFGVGNGFHDVRIPVPSLAPRVVWNAQAAIPNGCFSVDCRFSLSTPLGPSAGGACVG